MIIKSLAGNMIATNGRHRMVNEVKGIISKSKGAPVTVEKVLIPDPGPGEVLVEVKACGVCHTDLHYREGAISNDFPFFLGLP